MHRHDWATTGTSYAFPAFEKARQFAREMGEMMAVKVGILGKFAALLAGVLALLLVSIAPSLACTGAEEPTRTGAAAYADVTLDVFSGRPNPQWTLAADEIAPLLPDAGEPVQEEAPEPAGLGYRGFLITYVSAETGVPTEYQVYADTVTIVTASEQATFADTKGLEQWLLDDARQRGYGDVLEDTTVPLSDSQT